jgi:hypothetical protein
MLLTEKASAHDDELISIEENESWHESEECEWNWVPNLGDVSLLL